MRRMRWFSNGVSAVSAAALVAVNLLAVLGVLFAGWSLLLLLLMYWAESGIVGAVNVARIALAHGAEPARPGGGDRSWKASGIRLSRFVAIPLFIVHYGLFWVLHGVFVLLLPVFLAMGATLFTTSGAGSRLELVDLSAIDPRWAIAVVVGFGFSHVISFFVNYLGGGEHLAVTPGAQMFAVYGRVAVLHATVLVAAAVIGALGAPVGALVVFVLAKTALDLAFHVREHRRARPRGLVPARRVQVPGRTAPDS
jgi:hypothetical protein